LKLLLVIASKVNPPKISKPIDNRAWIPGIPDSTENSLSILKNVTSFSNSKEIYFQLMIMSYFTVYGMELSGISHRT